MKKPKYLVEVWQEDQWWLARVFGVAGGSDTSPLTYMTQAISRAAIEPMARDLVATILDASEDTFDIEIGSMSEEGNFMPHAKISKKTALWLGSDDDELEDGQPVGMQGYGFDVHSEDNMVSISGVTEGGDEFEVFIMRDLFPKIRAVMDRIDKRFEPNADEPALDHAAGDEL